MGTEDLYNTVEHAASYSIWLPVLASIFRIKALNRTLWILFIYLLLCFVADQLYLYILPDQETANRVINCWCVIETTLFFIIYGFEAKNKSVKKALWIGYSAFLVLAFAIFSKTLREEDKIVAPTEAGLFIVISAAFFIIMLFDKALDRPLGHYFFWINFALLLYFCASILIFVDSEEQLVWGMHHSTAILCNIFIAIGIWQMKQRRIQS
jgi:hypothetical protein